LNGRRTLVVSVALAAVILIAIAAPGGAIGPTADNRLGERQFAKSANRICRAANEQRDALYDDYSSKLLGQLPSTATLSSFVSEYEPIVQDQIDALSALRPPKNLQRNYDRLLTEARKALTTIVQDPASLVAALIGGDNPLAKVDRRARALGLRDCTT
jgi:hypothetical protein